MANPIKRTPDALVPISEPTRSDLNPHLSALATGGFVIGFDDAVSATDTNADGLTVRADGAFVSDIFTGDGTSNETAQGLYGLTNGNLVQVWTDTPTATNNSDIRAVFIDPSTGNQTAASFLVNVGNTAGNQVDPEVTELGNGNLAFAWIDIASGQIKAAVFDAVGNPITTNVTVSTTPSNQSGLDLGLTSLANGNFAVSWRTDSAQEHFRILNGNNGGVVTADITVPAAVNEGAGDIIQLANGTIEIVYRLAAFGVVGHAYDASGNSLGTQFSISTGNIDADVPAATALHDGRFMVVYQESGDIFGRIMNADGTPSSDEFRVNTDPTGFQSRPTIDTLPDGQVAVAWQDSHTGEGDIYYTVLDPRQSAVNLTGTDHADNYVGTDFDDTFTGGPGNDFLKGGLGADTFAFKNPTDGVDTIADFQQGQDHILLGSNFVSEGGGPHPLSSNVHFEYGPVASTASPTILVDNLHNHQLAWDSDGNGPAASQVLANVGFADANDVTLPDTTPISLPGLNGYSVLGTGDFNHNGGVDSDIVLRNNSSGAAEIWFMGGGAIIGDYPIGNLAGYSLNGTGDFNHNGTDDMLWRNNTSGVVETWLMHDGVRTGGDVLGNLTGYTALGTGDFNQDGNTDIVWQNNTSGAAEIWFMGGGHVIGDYSIGNLGGYSLLGVGDFNGDHTSDFLWRNNFSGVTETWLMQQGVPTGGSTIGNLANYQLLATTDVNHDGTDDLVWRNIADGTTSTWVMHNGQFQNEEQSLGTIPLSTVAAGSGDFTGDGGKDLLLLNSAANTTTFLDIEYHALTASDFLIV